MDDDERKYALQRLEILDAIWLACERRHEVLELVETAESADAALLAIAERFGLSMPQAMAILDLQFRRVAQRERTRIYDERAELRRLVGLE